MTYNPQVHNRKSMRKKGHDYKNGSYFITVCAVNREWLFGDIKNEVMVLSDLGEIVVEEWLKTERIRTNVKLDEYVVMPNHFHAIVHLTNHADGSERHRRGIARYAPTDAFMTQIASSPVTGQFQKMIPGSLGSVIRSFKSATTRHINRFRNSPATAIWQRNYYEHAIRNEEALQKIRTYIRDNPKHWFEDEEYSPPKK